MSFVKHTKSEGFEPVGTTDEDSKIASLDDLDERLAEKEEQREGDESPRDAA
jgi:hypothetical protein